MDPVGNADLGLRRNAAEGIDSHVSVPDQHGGGILPVLPVRPWFSPCPVHADLGRIEFVSVFPAYICWYAKGKGLPAILISAGILGVLLAQAVFLIQGIRMTHLPEVLTWLAGVIILRRKPKEFALEMALSVAVALVYQLFIPYWG